MAHLPTDLRSQLEKVIKTARREAEAGARNALESLAVDHHEYHGSMTPDERSLRNRLRAHGRQLGDRREARGTQSIKRLAREVAYEHWHRMLFARFLAENSLLVEPVSGEAISMGECQDLAREAGEDPHSMAARFAQDSLPQIFRKDDPGLEITLAPETCLALNRLLDSLPPPVFTAHDSLGWTYQYWQAEKKNAVNESGNRIGADELPAVTQLFTESYMVLFLYHNTIGAWHAGRVLAENPSLAANSQTEDELRQAVRLRAHGGYDFEHLRFVREVKEGDEEQFPTGNWRPAAGAFDGWPDTASELKILDPCCGSGHFLTEGFELLVRLRMDEEGLALDDAIRGVLAVNLHGLELDTRCTQIAAFNLALAAWKMAGKPITLPSLHIACSGLAVGSTKSEWTKLAHDDARLHAGMEQLYGLFEQAPLLGSLTDPKALEADLLVADFTELQPLLQRALEQDTEDVEYAERAVAAQGMAKAARLLLGKYALVITNVPFLATRKQSEPLVQHLQSRFFDERFDLATAMMSRSTRLLDTFGVAAFVSPQSWQFLGSYEQFRKKLLEHNTISVVARLGPGAFETISGQVVNAVLSIIGEEEPTRAHAYSALDVSEDDSVLAKAKALISNKVESVTQSEQRKNPDSVLLTVKGRAGSLLQDYSVALAGILNGDAQRFRFRFWEVTALSQSKWAPLQENCPATQRFGGRQGVILWENGDGQLRSYAKAVRERLHDADKRGNEAWGKNGIAVSRMGRISSTLFLGDLFDQNVAVILPKAAKDLPAIWTYCSSTQYESDLRTVNPSLAISSATVAKVPFDLEHWREVAAKRYPDGLPEPQSDDPTQWLFHGHPAKAEPTSALQVAVARLLGYRWPAELDPDMQLADEARQWIARSDALKGFADEDGIVCLSATQGERSAADRLRELLSAAFGSAWSAAKERELLAVAGDGKRPAASLAVWLRDKFFEEHCKLFGHRPFVWHIWDGNKDGFHCLVNTHRLTGSDGEGRRTLEAITYSYLNDWIGRQEAAQQAGQEGADARLAAAQELQGQLEKILEGESPYDLFIRWKSLHEQAVGWAPDINDGVRLNIRPFMKAELRKGGKKGAGVLRWKPNIKWSKDRGKESQVLRPKLDYPWFWSCEDQSTGFTGGEEFDGNRWNDLHYTNSAKKQARERRPTTTDAEVEV